MNSCGANLRESVSRIAASSKAIASVISLMRSVRPSWHLWMKRFHFALLRIDICDGVGKISITNSAGLWSDERSQILSAKTL